MDYKAKFLAILSKNGQEALLMAPNILASATMAEAKEKGLVVLKTFGKAMFKETYVEIGEVFVDEKVGASPTPIDDVLWASAKDTVRSEAFKAIDKVLA